MNDLDNLMVELLFHARRFKSIEPAMKAQAIFVLILSNVVCVKSMYISASITILKYDIVAQVSDVAYALS